MYNNKYFKKYSKSVLEVINPGAMGYIHNPKNVLNDYLMGVYYKHQACVSKVFKKYPHIMLIGWYHGGNILHLLDTKENIQYVFRITSLLDEQAKMKELLRQLKKEEINKTFTVLIKDNSGMDYSEYIRARSIEKARAIAENQYGGKVFAVTQYIKAINC